MKFKYDKNTEELIVNESTRIEYHQMELWLTRYVKNYKYSPAYKMNIWDGKQSYFRNGKINLGLWKEAWKGCKEIDVPFVVINKEDFPLNRDVTLEKVNKFCDEFFKTHKVKNSSGEIISFHPYTHQIETAYKILKNRYCMAEVATSGGKSLIISIVIFYILKNIDKNAKFLIIVPSITLVTQFYDNIFEYNYGYNHLEKLTNKEISIINKSTTNHSPCNISIEEIMSDNPRRWSGKKDANIYIGTYQSLEKWPKTFFKQFHTVITDECHKSKSKSYLKILGNTFNSAYNRFGLSGTTPSEDSCEILTIQSVLGPKISEISAVELKDKGIISPMQIKAVILNHNDEEYGQRVKSLRKSGYGKEAYELEKAYIHQSGKRIDFIKKIIDKCQTNTLLLFNTIEYGQELFNELSNGIEGKEFYYIDGEIPGKKREEIKKIMEITEGNTKILIASYGTLSTGVSINAIFNVIFADSFKSEQVIIQSIGRALRLHDEKKIANIFDIVDVFSAKDMSNILYNHFIERSKFYKKRKYPCKEVKINL